jgi:hypothetical protein
MANKFLKRRGSCKITDLPFNNAGTRVNDAN